MYDGGMTTATIPHADTADQLGDSQVDWLSEREMAAWLAYIEAQGDLMTALEVDLGPTDLTLGDYQVFVYLSNADDHSMRMCDLATMLQLSPSGLTRRLDGLVDAGWVERRNSRSDRRVMLAVLTDAGHHKLERAALPHLASVRRHIIDLLDPSELDAMTRIFGKIRDALDA
jgi:DNA-binding MarR family transcriptional regulator